MVAKKLDYSSKKCFIITPVGNDGSSIRREINGIIFRVIIPVLTKIGFVEENIYTAHLDDSPNVISSKIFTEIFNSDLVIANLTGDNPNVMYEVAMAHCFQKPIVHIIRDEVVLPFDVQPNRTISYKNDIEGSNELMEKLNKYVINALNGDCSNPVVEALSSGKVMEKMIGEGDIKVDSNMLVDLIEKVNRMDIALRDIRINKNDNNYKTFSKVYTNKVFELVELEYEFERPIKEIENTVNEFVDIVKHVIKSDLNVSRFSNTLSLIIQDLSISNYNSINNLAKKLFKDRGIIYTMIKN